MAADDGAEKVRLQKLIAPALGISRRRADDLLVAGRVFVDGTRARAGDTATAKSRILLDGRELQISKASACRMLAYHKPVGEECSYRPGSARRSVFAGLPALKTGRWIAVGRLDVTTSGLLLFATDGKLANRLMHPSGGFDREYLVRLRGQPDQRALQQLVDGVELEDGPARFADIATGPETEGSNRWYCVTLLEGRQRLIHRLFEAVGFQVSRLRRIRFGPVWLPRGLAPGGHVELSAAQLEALGAG